MHLPTNGRGLAAPLPRFPSGAGLAHLARAWGHQPPWGRLTGHWSVTITALHVLLSDPWSMIHPRRRRIWCVLLERRPSMARLALVGKYLRGPPRLISIRHLPSTIRHLHPPLLNCPTNKQTYPDQTRPKPEPKPNHHHHHHHHLNDETLRRYSTICPTPGRDPFPSLAPSPPASSPTLSFPSCCRLLLLVTHIQISVLVVSSLLVAASIPISLYSPGLAIDRLSAKPRRSLELRDLVRCSAALHASIAIIGLAAASFSTISISRSS
ncbi:hypothetical protein FALBO_17023 [Fusarium albosuccineum]|uniref:Uncharacterized protein n=1 Tax=Fusarium albosuccineum TaxID=1237068 RepID=A0A8H4KD68_9HYPO|nr:hypothetical protein FALBO_17023 [Fusarium albosuccineum]